MFKSKKELVTCIRDVLGVIRQAQEQGVRHRDCSMLNMMIEDLPDKTSRGLLLDWEFAVEITKRGEYTMGGTGTLLFMSVNLFRQLEKASAKSAAVTASSVHETASLTRVFVNSPITGTVRHTCADDVESLLYILTWIIVMYDGPHGHERQDISHENTFLALWNEKAASDLMIARNAKFTFLIDESERKIDDSVTPYCKELLPLVHQWRALHRNAFLADALVELSDVVRVLGDFIAGMLDELSYTPDDSTAQSLSSPPPLASPVATLSDSSKRLRDEAQSIDNPPLPSKRLKTDRV